ncbi:hypothetical protein ABK040_002514 [Willaertia magna]
MFKSTVTAKLSKLYLKQHSNLNNFNNKLIINAFHHSFPKTKRRFYSINNANTTASTASTTTATLTSDTVVNNNVVNTNNTLNCPYHQQQQLKQEELFEKIPLAKGYPIIGNSIEFLNIGKNFFNIFENYRKQYGDIYEMNIFGKKFITITNPELFLQICRETELRPVLELSKIYKKEKNMQRIAIELDYDEDWMSSRKVFNVLYNNENTKQITLPQLWEMNDDFISFLERHIESDTHHLNPFKNLNEKTFGGNITLLNEIKENSIFKEFPYIYLMNHYTFDSVFKVLFGKRAGTLDEFPSNEAITLFSKATKLFELFVHSFFDPGFMFLKKWSPLYKRFVPIADCCYKMSNEFYKNQMKEQQQSIIDNHFNTDNTNKEGNDKRLKNMLELMIEKAKEESIFNEKDFVQNTVVAILNGANDTTSAQFSFILYALALHPEVQDKIYEESIKVFGPLNDYNNSSKLPEVFNEEKFSKMKYLQHFIQEIFRLYPITSIIQRIIDRDIVIERSYDGDNNNNNNGEGVHNERKKKKRYLIPKGSTVFYNNIIAGRDERLVSNPELFIPERFQRERASNNNSDNHNNNNGVKQQQQQSKETVARNVVLPFGVGFRRCPGEKVATAELKLATLLFARNFKFSTNEVDFPEIDTNTVFRVKSKGKPIFAEKRI